MKKLHKSFVPYLFLILIVFTISISIIMVNKQAEAQGINDGCKKIAIGIFNGKYGDLKDAKLTKSELDSSMFVYTDESYRYSFDKRGKLYSIAKYTNTDNKVVDMTMAEAELSTKSFVKKVINGIDFSKCNMVVKQKDGYNRWYFKFNKISSDHNAITGVILAYIDEYGDISYFVNQGDFDNEVPKKVISIEKAQAISIAYTTLPSLVKKYSDEQLALISSQQENVKPEDDIVISDDGKTMSISDIKPIAPVFDLSDKALHKVQVELYCIDEQYHWDIIISNVHASNLDFTKTFYFRIDAVTGEVLELGYNR
jgi:hypothetical protein